MASWVCPCAQEERKSANRVSTSVLCHCYESTDRSQSNRAGFIQKVICEVDVGKRVELGRVVWVLQLYKHRH